MQIHAVAKVRELCEAIEQILAQHQLEHLSLIELAFEAGDFLLVNGGAKGSGGGEDGNDGHADCHMLFFLNDPGGNAEWERENEKKTPEERFHSDSFPKAAES